MPVVVMMRERQDFYVNVSHPDFRSTVFAALKHTRKDENGQMIAEFEEFVPCSEVEDILGYVPIDQTGNYYQDIALPNSKVPAAEFDDRTMIDVAGSVLEHAEARTRNALCPKSLDKFAASFDYNTFLFESDLEIYVTTCQVAANEKAYLEKYGFVNVTGLPDQSRCLGHDEGMAKYLDRMSAQVVMRE